MDNFKEVWYFNSPPWSRGFRFSSQSLFRPHSMCRVLLTHCANKTFTHLPVLYRLVHWWSRYIYHFIHSWSLGSLWNWGKVQTAPSDRPWVVNEYQSLSNLFITVITVLSLTILKWIHWVSIRIQNFMVLRWLVQVFHPPQKFECAPFCNGCSYSIKNYGVEVTFNRNVSVLNFIKICQFVQKLLGGTDTQTGWWSH
jgi:hypothetical protein